MATAKKIRKPKVDMEAKNERTESMETKDIATQGPKELAASQAAGAWGTEGIESKDILLPKVLLMQGLSEIVKAQNAKAGDMLSTLTNEVLGGEKSPVEFIPLMQYKNWVISQKPPKAKRFEYVKTIPVTPDNANLPWEETLPDGTIVQNTETLNFYVLLVSELARGEAIPYVVPFRRTSYKAGKKVVTHFARMQMLKQPGAAKTLKLVAKADSNENGDYFVFDVEPGRNSTQEELAAAYQWYQTISQGVKAGTVKVDESDVLAEAAAPARSEVPVQSGPARF